MIVVRILLRSTKSSLKIKDHGEKTIFTSIRIWKEDVTIERPQNSEEEKLTKKRQLMKWHSTNLALFGPIIKEKKRRKNSQTLTQVSTTTTTDESQAKECIKPNMILPVNLWNAGIESEVKLGKKGVYPVKNLKVQKQIPGELKKNVSTTPSTSNQLINEVISSTFIKTIELKGRKKLKKEKVEIIKDEPSTENISKKNLKTKEDLKKSSVLEPILSKLPVVELNENLTQTLKLTSESSYLPSTPFFLQNNVVLPFPMVMKNKPSNFSLDGIVTLGSIKADVPSVTQVLNKTMSDKSEMMLALWRKRKIAEVGEEGLRDFMRESKLTGKDLHLSIETYLRGVEYSSIRVEPRIAGHWLSMKSILTSISDVHVLESYVVHPYLKYKGFVDCVARYQDNLVVIEWKTSQRTKSTLEEAYDDPVQIAAYIGALNADSHYPFEIENAILVVAYPTGRPADVMTLDRSRCDHYWNLWLKRLEAFNHLKSAPLKGE